MTEAPRGHLDETTLDRWRTGELAGEERARAAEHVSACAECARALAGLEGFAELVGRAYAADRAAHPGPDVARLRERVAAAVRAPARAGPSVRPGWSRWIPHAAAAAVAFLVLGVLWREGVRGPADAGRLARPESAAVERALDGAAPPAAPPSAETEAAAGLADGADADALRQEAGPPAPSEDRVPARRDAPAAELPSPPAAPPPAAYRERDEEIAKAREEAEAAGRAAPGEAREEAPALADAVAQTVDPHDRFADQARAALAERDRPAALRALSLWRDTLAPREALDAPRRLQAESLADSLAAFLAE